MRNLFTLLLLSFTFFSYAQDSTATTPKDTVWSTGGVAGLNFTQTSFSNWAAGGENSVSGTAYTSLYANYAKKKTTWDNSLDLAYGLLKQGGDDWVKNDDRIQFISKYGQYARKHWYYSGILDFRTQFAPGYNLPNDSIRISNFLAPAYLVAAIGMDYKPNKDLAILIAPVTGKMTIVNDEELANAGAFGVEGATYAEDGTTILTEGSRIRNEFGGFVKVIYKKELKKDVVFQTSLDLFSNYIENPQNIDVNWETLLTMKITRFISVNLSTHLIYDDDIKILIDEETGQSGPRLQFKQVLGIGLAYQFKNK